MGLIRGLQWANDQIGLVVVVTARELGTPRVKAGPRVAVRSQWPLQFPAYGTYVRESGCAMAYRHGITGLEVGFPWVLIFFCCLGVLGCLGISRGSWLNAFSRMAVPRVPFCSRQSSSPLSGKRLPPSDDA